MKVYIHIWDIIAPSCRLPPWGPKGGGGTNIVWWFDRSYVCHVYVICTWHARDMYVICTCTWHVRDMYVTCKSCVCMSCLMIWSILLSNRHTMFVCESTYHVCVCIVWAFCSYKMLILCGHTKPTHSQTQTDLSRARACAHTRALSLSSLFSLCLSLSVALSVYADSIMSNEETQTHTKTLNTFENVREKTEPDIGLRV
jgi:hypothetical protein